jgi:hypothetical protein
MTDTKPIHRITIIGTAVIGASWTALCFKTNFHSYVAACRAQRSQ